MIRAKFIYHETEPIGAKFSFNKPQAVTANFRMNSGGTKEHNQLTNRDLPDQHPIFAITGLEEALSTFVFEQGIASNKWVIEHNLNKHPSVTVVDSAGNVQIPDEVSYDNANQITIKLISAFAGKAFLN